jgi:DNA-binding MarR family transcriptional regulator
VKAGEKLDAELSDASAAAARIEQAIYVERLRRAEAERKIHQLPNFGRLHKSLVIKNCIRCLGNAVSDDIFRTVRAKSHKILLRSIFVLVDNMKS